MSLKRIASLSTVTLAALTALSLSAKAQMGFTYQEVIVPGRNAVGSLIEGISANGSLAGTYVTDTATGDIAIHGWTRNAVTGAYTTIDQSGAGSTWVWTGGINNAGFVTGDAYKNSDRSDPDYLNDFVYNSSDKTFHVPQIKFPGTNTTAAITGLKNVNEAGIVAVQYSDDLEGTYHHASYNIGTGAFTYYDDIPGYDNDLEAVGPNGELVLTLVNPSGHNRGYITKGGVSTFLDVPGEGGGTIAEAINAKGLVSGYYRDAAGVEDGFVYDSLSGTYSTLAFPGATGTYLTHGNNDNEFAGYFFDANGSYHSFIATAVPEPSACALLIASGLTGTAFLRRRNRKGRVAR